MKFQKRSKKMKKSNLKVQVKIMSEQKIQVKILEELRIDLPIMLQQIKLLRMRLRHHHHHRRRHRHHRHRHHRHRHRLHWMKKNKKKKLKLEVVLRHHRLALSLRRKNSQAIWILLHLLEAEMKQLQKNLGLKHIILEKVARVRKQS